MEFNEKLLTACQTREIPHLELWEMVKPIKGTKGNERLNLQNKIAEEIERKYPLKQEQK